MSESRPRLGKGLEALIPKSVLFNGKTITNLPLNHIRPNPFQPRGHFKPEALQSLSESIKQHGLNQPIVVRKNGNHYELIAGERRYRACQMANIETIPAIIRNVSDKESLQIALIENLEREDLTCIEEAKGYQRLIQEFNLTHNLVGDIFGKSRSAVSNTLRLLHLPQVVQDALSENIITEGHARSLLALETETKILEAFEFIKSNQLNVRQIESHIAQIKQKKQTKPPTTPVQELLNFEKTLTQTWHCPIKIKGKPNRGKIEIQYESAEQLEALYNKLIQ